MTRRPRLPTPIALVVLTGCILYFDAREDERPPLPEGDSARLLFERDVYPILAEKCVSCHAIASPSAIGFVDADPAETYAVILESGIAIDQGHAAAAYTADEHARIIDWLSQEAEERQATAPAPFADQEVREWSGCMSYDDFVDTDMPAGDAAMSFRALTEDRAVLLAFFAVDVSTGVGSPRMVINTRHPWVTQQGPPLTALQRFYELTRMRQTDHRCDPPRLKN